MPRVTVITPTYNRPTTLARALESIEMQTWDDLEVLVVNDGGEDVSSIVAEFPRARYISHDTNRGLSAARNTAIRESSGEYVAYLDDDDVWYPNHLSTLMGSFFRGARFAYSDCLYWMDDERLAPGMSVDYSRETLLKFNVTPILCVAHERSLFDEAGVFTEGVPNHEDYDLWLRFSERTEFCHVPIVTCAYSRRTRGPSQMSADQTAMAEGLARTKERYWKSVQERELVDPGKSVMVFCPTYERNGIDMLWPDTRDSINALEAPEGVSMDVVIGRDNPWPSMGHKNTLHQYQSARRTALDSGYSALLTVEHDMIVPRDALVKMWTTPASVVYGVYMLRHAIHGVNAFRKVEGKASAKESLSNYPALYREAVSRGWAEVGGVGSGCTLIRRSALERFPFRGTRDNDPPDWQFAIDCGKAGVTQVARFDVMCGHIDDNGKVLWPDIDGLVATIKPTQPFNCWVEGVSRPFVPGQEYEIPTQEALDLERAGWATVKRVAEPAFRMARQRRVMSGGGEG